MKKRISFLLALILIFSMIFAGCDVDVNINSGESGESNTEDPSSLPSEENSSDTAEEPSNPETDEPIHENNQDPSSYESLINTLYYTESSFGEAFIGYVEGPMGTGYREFFEERGYMEKYPFVADIPYERYIETNGNEMYCIVPRDPESSVAVNEWIASPTGGSYGEVLYRSESGEPIIITCNEEPTVPNVKVVIVDSNGDVFEFSPVYNAELDWLYVYETPEAHSYDFTVYENAEEKSVMVFDDLLGDWAGTYSPYGDKTIQMHFTFYRAAYGEPCVTFWYGEEYGDVIEYYEGYAYEQYDENGEFTGNMILDMVLTQGTNSAEKGPKTFMGLYEFRYSDWDSNCMIASRSGEGDLLMEEYGLGFIEFLRAMG